MAQPTPLGRTPRRSITRQAATTRWLILGLWSAHLALSPFYTYPSGQPQLADMVLSALVGCLLLCGVLRLPAPLVPAAKAATILVMWVAAVSVSWWLATGDVMFLKPVAFYGYNLAAFLTPVVLYQYFGAAFVRWTLATVATSVSVQIVMSFFSNGHFERFGSEVAILYFNNSGQCAYYALLAGGMCLTCCSQFELRSLPWITRTQSLLYGGIVLLCFFTASRSGSVCALLLMLLALWGRRLRQTLAYGVGAACLAVVILYSGFGETVAEKVMARAQNVRQSLVDELHHRGYDRIANHPEFWLLGAGERFMEDDPRIESEFRGEVHSTIGSVFFSYGIVGLVLFAAVFGAVARVSGVAAMLPMAPVFLYGVTTNGVRHSEFWSLAAMIGCAGVARAVAAARGATAAPARRPRRATRRLSPPLAPAPLRLAPRRGLP